MAEKLNHYDAPWMLWDMLEKRVYEYYPSHRTAMTASIGPNNQAKANDQGTRYVVLPNLNWRKK